MITPDISLGQLLMTGVTLTIAGISGLTGYIMLRANAESTATKLGEHTKAAEKAMETLASGVKSSMDSMGSRIGSVEHDVNALRLEIAKEYVSSDKLREHEDRMSKRMEGLEHQVRQVPQQVVGLLNVPPVTRRRTGSN